MDSINIFKSLSLCKNDIYISIYPPFVVNIEFFIHIKKEIKMEIYKVIEMNKNIIINNSDSNLCVISYFYYKFNI